MALDFGSGALSTGTSLLGAGLGIASQFGNGGLAPGAEQSHINTSSVLNPWMSQQWQNAFGAQNAAANRTAGQAVAGFTPAQLQAMQGIQGSIGYGMPALGQAQGNAQTLAGGIGPQQIQNFMNPFTQSAVQSTLNTMNQQKAQQDAAISGQASLSNAFGGDRSAVAQALNDQNWDLAEGQTISGLNNSGFQNAMQGAFQNQNAQLAGNSQFQNAILNNIGANTAQYQNLLGVGNQQQGLAQQQANWPIMAAQIMGQNLNPNTGSTQIGTKNFGTMQNPITGALTGLQGGLQWGNAINQGLQGLGGAGQALGGLSQAFGGSGSGLWGGPSANDVQGGYGMTGDPTQYFQDPSSIDASTASGWDPTAYSNDYFGSGGFNSAGGEAANQLPEVTVNGQAIPDQVASDAQSTNNSALAGYNASQPNSQPGFGVGSALGDASNALNIYTGLQRGGISGYGGAALGMAKLGSNLSGTQIPGLGVAGSALGIYNGIRQGGVMGSATAALDTAQLLGGVGQLAGGTAAGGLGSLAMIGAYAGPIGLALAPVLYGMSKPAVQVTGQWVNNDVGGLQQQLSSSDPSTRANAQITLASQLSNESLKATPQLWQLAQQYGVRPISQMFGNVAGGHGGSGSSQRPNGNQL
jgi:hypothetical protein